MARQTAAERQAESKANFLRDAKEKFDDLVTTYFLGQGYFVMVDDIERSDLPIAARIAKPVERYLNSRRLVDDGANLTDKRKVEMLEAIYEIEDTLARTPTEHPILPLYRQVTSKRTSRFMLIVGAVICGLIAIAAPPMLVGAIVFAILAYRKSRSIGSLISSIRQQAIQAVSSI